MLHGVVGSADSVLRFGQLGVVLSCRGVSATAQVTLFEVTVVGGFASSRRRRGDALWRGGHQAGRMSIMAGQRMGYLLALVVLVAGASTLHACTLPVFRYALESWEAAPYEVTIFHKGALSEKETSAVDLLRAGARGNMSVQVVDLAGSASEVMQKLWKSQEGDRLPRVVVCFPGPVDPAKVVWSGPLDEGSVRFIADSPKRRALAREILDGHGIVWVVLESGNKERDDAAVALLLDQSAEVIGRTQGLAPSDSVAGEPGQAAPSSQDSSSSEDDGSWALSCGLVRLSRKDPAEAVFVRMLLSSEAGLERITGEPIAFPVFGRGRAFYALVGGGINRKTIEEVVVFLGNPCSCVLKELNPGFDLLMSADWEAGIAETMTAAPTLPPLTGVRPEVPLAGYQRSEDSTEGSLWRNVLIIVLVSVAVVGVGVFVLRRRSSVVDE